MKSLWKESEAAAFGLDPLGQRVYSSRLLGREPSLVLHGGGNTSVKCTIKDFFSDSREVLYVKGSGWDLATIERQGFSPVAMETLLRLADLDQLTDTDMVKAQRMALLDPDAPNPSVEAILHAIIPYPFVDHTHADAMIAITNTPQGEKLIREALGDRVLYLPYIMPGFDLAKLVHKHTRNIQWEKYDGIVLHKHGLFSFGENARQSYERMIQMVDAAERFLERKSVTSVSLHEATSHANLLGLAHIRKEVSAALGSAVVAKLETSKEAAGFAFREDVGSLACRGPLTPDHVIHTKQFPLILPSHDEKLPRLQEISASLKKYTQAYKDYFERNRSDQAQICLDPAPRWAVWPKLGVISFGVTPKRAEIVNDIVRHTIRAEQISENLGGWSALSEKEIFEVEYWELEQAKLKKSSKSLPLQGRVALVTGAASGIGKACMQSLRDQGAAVVGLDQNAEVAKIWSASDALGICCDVTDRKAQDAAVAAAVRRFGGLDIVVPNAGIFPASKSIENIDDELWDRTLGVNLTSQMALLRACTPFLKLGVQPTVLFVASKNVPAPGPGAAPYSVSKAGVTQLARVAALELAPFGIRINVVHPHAVMDTGIWQPEVLEARAKSYGMSVEEYKRNNLLKVQINSEDVGRLISAMAGPLFGKITGAQISIDGGNDRVI